MANAPFDRPCRIGVIGTSRAEPQERELARAVGAGLAAAGAVVVCGGLGGVMEAVAEGAAERGGAVVGVLPGTNPEDANSWITLPLPTGLGQARNLVIVHTAESLIAIGKGHGTLSEIAFALRLGKPVFGLDTWDVDPGVVAVADAAEAVRLALSAARSGR